MEFNISSDEQRCDYARQLSGPKVNDIRESPAPKRLTKRARIVRAGGTGNRRYAGAASNPYFRSAPEYARHNSDSLLLEAFTEKRYDQLRRLLEAKGLYTPVLNKWTIADLAVTKKNEQVLKMLADMGFDFNRRNEDGMVPFHYAVRRSLITVMLLLYQLGASADVPFPLQTSAAAASAAAASGDSEAFLIEKRFSEFPLHVACGMHTTKVLDVLLNDCNANSTVQDWQRNTPLHRACLEDSQPHAVRLIAGASAQTLNQRGFEGKTALHIAVLNQNRRLMQLLLQHGALVDVPADNAKTVVDILLEINNPILLQSFVRFVILRAADGMDAASLRDLSYEPLFHHFLLFLTRIDNEYMTCSIEYKDLSEGETTELCSRLEFDERIDLIEFKEVILQLLQTEAIHSLLETCAQQTLRKVVENVVHYVLFREDAELLERIMLCGQLWAKMSEIMENSLDALYLQTPEREVNGIVQHFRTNFISEGAVSHDRLSAHYGQLCSCYNLPPYRPDLSSECQYMRHPMDTLPVWSVLCGRLALTELLLRQEQFDVVPLALFCSAILRTFVKNPELVVEQEEIEELALTCEKFARKTVEKLYAIDTSHRRSVTVNYLLRPQESYGGVSCAQLAAANKCAHFLQSESCQLALDKKWFRSLLYTNAVLREILIWTGVVPLNIFVPLILVCFDETELHERRRHERPPAEQEKPPSVSEKFQLSLMTRSMASTDSFHSHQHLHKPLPPSPKPHSFLRANFDFREQQQQPSSHGDQLLPDDRLSSGFSSLGQRTFRRFRRFFELLYQFYGTPAVKFRYHVAAHALLVAMLSYCLLIDFTYQINYAEITAYAILFGMFLEEVGEVVQYQMRNSLRTYLHSKWNVIDVTALGCGFIGFSIRMFEMLEMKNSTVEWTGMDRDFLDKAWYMARLFLSVCCTLYWVRLLYISTVLENLGPKLNMIAKMITKDLLPFLLILFIFIFGFGVLMHSLLYPNGYRAWNPKQLNKVHVFLGMLKICFYSMVGEYSLDSILGEEQCEDIYANSTVNEGNCPHHFGRYLVPYVVLPLYVIVTEILLLNLIIAMFSKTIDKIDAKSKGLWQFERHNLVEEFESRSALPPPLNVFDLLRKLLLMLLHRTRSCANAAWRQPPFDAKPLMQLLLFQALALRNCRDELMRQCLPKQETEAESLLKRVRTIVQVELERILGSGDEAGAIYDTGETFSRGTLFESVPPADSELLLAAAGGGDGYGSDADPRAPQSPGSAGRSIDSRLTDVSKRSVVLRDLKRD